MQKQNSTKPNYLKDIEVTEESSNSNTSYADNAELTEQEQTATANTDIDNASVRDNSREETQTEMVQLSNINTEKNTSVDHVADKTESNSLDTDNSLSDTSKTLKDNTVVTNTSVEDKDSYTEVNKSDANRADTTVINNTLEDNKSVVNTYTAINTTDIDNTDTVNTDSVEETDDTEKKLTNIEKYNMSISAEQRKENAKKAAIKSGEVRRERRTLGEHLKALLSVGDTQEEICLGIIEQAKKGNYKAFNSIRDTIGEMPTVKQEITADVTTDADRQLMEKLSKRLNVTE